MLIADDSEHSANSLGMLLRMEGHEVVIVHDGVQALLAFATQQPEFALLDIGMPGLSGYEVAEQIRRKSPARRVTLIAVTGWDEEGDRARAQAAGFDHHFTKPVEPDRLMELLQE